MTRKIKEGLRKNHNNEVKPEMNLYTCPVCGAGFLSRQQLEDHKKKSHGVADEPEDQTTIEDTED